MRSPNFLWASAVFIVTLLARGEPIHARADLVKCIQENSSTVPQLKGLDANYKAIAALPASALKFLLGQDDRRVVEASNIVGQGFLDRSPQFFEFVGADGKKIYQFRLGNYKSNEWDDPDFLKLFVDNACKRDDPETAVFCSHAFFERQKNYGRFKENQDASINALAKFEGENWADALGGKRFDVDPVTDGNLRYGAIMTMTALNLLKKFGFSTPMVTNRDGQVVGFLLPISSDGRPEHYVAEIVSGSSISDATLKWPYSRVFAQSVQDPWNEIVARRHGGQLFVNGQPLNEYIANIN